MCWWFLYHIRLKVRQTELHFSFLFFFPEWYFCSKDSVGIIVLRLWDSLCWYLLWVLSGDHPSTLLSWEVGTALPDFQLPVHVPISGCPLDMKAGLLWGKLLALSAHLLRGLWRLAYSSTLSGFGDLGAEPLTPQEAVSPAPFHPRSYGARNICMARTSQSSLWELHPSLSTLESPNVERLPSDISALLIAPTQDFSQVSWNLNLFWDLLSFSCVFVLPPQRSFILSRTGRKKSLFSYRSCESLCLLLRLLLLKSRNVCSLFPGSSLPPHLGAVLDSLCFLITGGSWGQK